MLCFSIKLFITFRLQIFQHWIFIFKGIRHFPLTDLRSFMNILTLSNNAETLWLWVLIKLNKKTLIFHSAAKRTQRGIQNRQNSRIKVDKTGKGVKNIIKMCSRKSGGNPKEKVEQDQKQTKVKMEAKVRNNNT